MVKDRFSKQLWMSLGIIVISILISGGVLYFFTGDLSANADAIMAAHATIQTQNDALANLANLKQQAPQAAQYQAEIHQLIPDQYGLVPFAQWFKDEGSRYNVTADAVFQGSIVPAQGSTPGTISFSFNVQGTPSNLISFLDTVSATSTSSGFLLTINSFNITMNGTSANATGQGTLFSR